MARVLILGGGGFIGPAVVGALERAGHEAVPASRSSLRFAVDRNDPAAVQALVRREACDTLIDMIAYDAMSTERLMAALGAYLARHVVLSSADVYRSYGAFHRREDADTAPALLGEDAPRRSSRYPYREAAARAPGSPEAWKDSYEKIHVEDASRAAGATIIRLPMVYGPGDRNRRFAWITAPMQAGASEIAAPAMWLDWVTTYGHVENVAEAIALCAIHPAAEGQVFNCGEAPVPHRVWIQRFARHLDWAGTVRADGDGWAAARLAALDLRHHLAIDTSRIRERLGYVEVIEVDEALKSVI